MKTGWNWVRWLLLSILFASLPSVFGAPPSPAPNFTPVPGMTPVPTSTPGSGFAPIPNLQGNLLDHLLQKWRALAPSPVPRPSPVATQTPERTNRAIRVRAWKVSGRPLLVGVDQRLLIDAPLKKIASLLEDFKSYPEIMPGLVSVEPASGGGGVLITNWIQRIPVPFVPNIHYQIVYSIQSDGELKKSYRYSLATPGKIKQSDGLILLQSKGNDQTYYREIDFFEADWGIARSFVGEEGIWKESVEEIIISDLALRLKAESKGSEKEGNWLKLAKKEAETYPIAKWVKERSELPAEIEIED